MGVLMATVFALLRAPDVALTQAIINSGLVTSLLLVAYSQTRKTPRPPEICAECAPWLRWRIPALVCGLLAALLFRGFLSLAAGRPLGTASSHFLSATLRDTGGMNVVGAILLDYRAFDTLGETTVIFAAVSGVSLLLSGGRQVHSGYGLSFIVNEVLDREERIYRCVCGDPEKAHAAGCEASREIFGVPFPEYADIVITDTFPADSELWQAAKGIYAGDLPLKKGGVLVTVTPCPEGVAQGHPELTDIGYLPFAEAKAMVDRGEIEDLTLAAHIVHVGRIIRDKGRGIMVCPCIGAETSRKLGFAPAATPQEAVDLAFSMTGPGAKVIVLQNGGDLLPILRPEGGSST